MSTPLDHPYQFYPHPPEVFSDTHALKKSLRPMWSNQDRSVIDPPLDFPATAIWDAWATQSQPASTSWQMVNLTPERSTPQWVGGRQCATPSGSRWMFWPPPPEIDSSSDRLVQRLAAVDAPNPNRAEYPCADVQKDMLRAWRMAAIVAHRPVLSQEIKIGDAPQVSALPSGWYTVRTHRDDQWKLLWKHANVARVLMQPEEHSREWLMTARDLSEFPWHVINQKPLTTIASRPEITPERSMRTQPSSHPRF